MNNVARLYEQDFYAWTQENARLLKEGRLVDVDLEHLAEEIEGMGASERRELDNRLLGLLMHLLKWAYQPGRRGSSWRHSVVYQRAAIETLFEESPSLKAQLDDRMEKIYGRARRYAASETDLPVTAFPEMCPWTVSEITDSAFWPKA